MTLTASPMQDLNLPNFPWTKEDLGDPLFKYGQIVCERYCDPTRRVPFKITWVIRPSAAKGYYFKGYEYKLSAVFPEDRGEVLHENEVPAPECMLMDFEDAKENIIGALLSKARDIKEMKQETI